MIVTYILYFKMANIIKLSSKWILLKILKYTDVSAPSTLFMTLFVRKSKLYFMKIL